MLFIGKKQTNAPRSRQMFDESSERLGRNLDNTIIIIIIFFFGRMFVGRCRRWCWRRRCRDCCRRRRFDRLRTRRRHIRQILRINDE